MDIRRAATGTPLRCQQVMGVKRLPKILKIIGKSALCFIGLVVCSWLLMQLHELNTGLGNTGSVILVMFVVQIFTFTLPFLLTIAYSYILFRLFIRERYRHLIIAMNGLFILVLYIVLLVFRVNTYIISYLDAEIAQLVSIPVIALALMYKYLSGKRKTQKKLYGRAANAMLILMKSFVCMCLLVVLAIAGYAFGLLRIPSFFIMMLQEINCLNLLTAIVYTFVLYIAFKRHKHIFWIIAVNSVFSLVAWSLIILRALDVSMLFSFVCFNAALIPPVLAFVFRSVEKHGNIESSYYKDSSAANASLE